MYGKHNVQVSGSPCRAGLSLLLVVGGGRLVGLRLWPACAKRRLAIEVLTEGVALGGALLLAGLVSAAVVTPAPFDRRCDLGHARPGAAAGAGRVGSVSARQGGAEGDGMKHRSSLANRSATTWC